MHSSTQPGRLLLSCTGHRGVPHNAITRAVAALVAACCQVQQPASTGCAQPRTRQQEAEKATCSRLAGVEAAVAPPLPCRSSADGSGGPAACLGQLAAGSALGLAQMLTTVPGFRTARPWNCTARMTQLCMLAARLRTGRQTHREMGLRLTWLRGSRLQRCAVAVCTVWRRPLGSRLAVQACTPDASVASAHSGCHACLH